MKDDQKPRNISRRSLFKMAAALAATGALAWANKTPFEAEEVVIGVDLAEPGADETVVTTGHIDAPSYFLAPGQRWPAPPKFKGPADERED